MKKGTYEPAFPLASEELSDRLDAGIKLHTGITIRDYFAAKAMQTLIAATNYELTADEISHDAYLHADAMLKAREEAAI